VGVSGPIRLGVRISHMDVNNDIRPTCPEASNEEISRSSSLERDKRWTGGLGSLALVSSAVRLEWIIGSTRSAEGASALDAKSHISSLSRYVAGLRELPLCTRGHGPHRAAAIAM
jgi:hypothetical protein